jgi:uncharacterized membrane protein
VNLGRLEAFSDGVIAVAITLLVLGLSVPAPHAHGDLLRELGHRWPEFAAYVISFLTIGIIWINHHSMIARLERGDHVILVVNLLVLMTICLIPFATDLMATYLKAGAGEHVAATVYSGVLLLMALAFSLLNWNILLHRAHLLRAGTPDAERSRIFRRAVSGIIPYVVATAVAPFSAYASLAICGAVAVYYTLPVASGR